jgi:predicted Zn-dependent protease
MVEESLGYLAWQSGDKDAALSHFERALAAGTKNARMCFDYAMLSRSGSDAVKSALPAFQKALDLKPDYDEARLQLGLMLVNTRNYPEAIAQLRQIKKVDPEQAQWYFPALAFAYLQAGDKAEARENAELAKKWAKTPKQIEHADALLRSLETQNLVAEGVPSRELAPRIQRAERMSCMWWSQFRRTIRSSRRTTK